MGEQRKPTHEENAEMGEDVNRALIAYENATYRYGLASRGVWRPSVAKRIEMFGKVMAARHAVVIAIAARVREAGMELAR